MAAIDKLYVKSWNEWKEVLDWAIDKEIQLKNGLCIQLKDYIYYPKNTEEDVNAWLEYERKLNMENQGYSYEEAVEKTSIPFWNTPEYVDIWLIRNCPIKIVQDRLKEQYGDLYDDIKNGTSVYDTYERNGLGKNFKYKVLKKPNEHHIHLFYGFDNSNNLYKYKDNRKQWWSISLTDIKHSRNSKDHIMWMANNDYNYWTCDKEALPFDSSLMDFQRKMPSIKSIIRMIKKWNLPDGTLVEINNSLFDIEWRISIKKK